MLQSGSSVGLLYYIPGGSNIQLTFSSNGTYSCNGESGSIPSRDTSNYIPVKLSCDLNNNLRGYYNNTLLFTTAYMARVQSDI